MRIEAIAAFINKVIFSTKQNLFLLTLFVLMKQIWKYDGLPLFIPEVRGCAVGPQRGVELTVDAMTLGNICKHAGKFFS